MNASTPGHETVVSTLSAALAPYPWRGFTPELLARIALAARDRQELAAALAEVEGAAPGTWKTLEPADRGDPRVPRLVEHLAHCSWSALTLRATCRHLVGGLLAGHRHAHLALAVDDEVTGYVDDDLAQGPGEPEG